MKFDGTIDSISFNDKPWSSEDIEEFMEMQNWLDGKSWMVVNRKT